MIRAEFLTAIADIEAAQWNRLFGGDNPFTRHEFLHAMEQSECVSAEAGWQPQHIVLYKDEQLLAAMPMYLKSHSYGEFVFDWAWAEAYERHGLNYYPKLLSAVPFTPSSGPRIGIASGEDRLEIIGLLLEQVKQKAVELNCSGWNLLFPDDASIAELDALESKEPDAEKVLFREDVQFHWFNRSFQSFEDFLQVLRSSRRKNIKRERKSLKAHGVTLERKTGAEITQTDWLVFYECYCETYLKRSGHSGYLDRRFFDILLENMRDSLMLVLAKLDDKPVACSLFFYDSNKLYGRYWGCLANIDFLHFEACFYQGIEFCIEQSLGEFDPGTQGEHKLLRGFEPYTTHSCHWIADPRFRQAIKQFLETETEAKRSYSKQVSAYLPFKRDQD